MGHGDHSVLQNLEGLGWEGLGFKDRVYSIISYIVVGTFFGFLVIVEGARGLFLLGPVW